MISRRLEWRKQGICGILVGETTGKVHWGTKKEVVGGQMDLWEKVVRIGGEII
jgi:hypothetical protein